MDKSRIMIKDLIRSLLKRPKDYFFKTEYVSGNDPATGTEINLVTNATIDSGSIIETPPYNEEGNLMSMLFRVIDSEGYEDSDGIEGVYHYLRLKCPLCS